MLLAIKGSVCWSPSTAPAPRTVLAVLGERLVEMSECGTCRGEKACLSCMARTGLSGLMVQKRRSLQMAASHHHCHRVGAARPSHGSSSAAQLAASRAALKHGCSGMPMRAGHATAARTTGVAQQDSALAWPRARRRGVNVLSPFRSHHSWNYPPVPGGAGRPVPKQPGAARV